jgi:hypothetical protein
MSLATIIHQINVWDDLSNRTGFPSTKIDPTNITQADADRIFQKIDGELSPENLHCDGEISRSSAQRKLNGYKAAVKELARKGFRPTVRVYEIHPDWLK